MDSDTLKEVVVATSAVGLVIAAMAVIGLTYGNSSGVLSTEGGRILAYSIAGFVILMTIIGYSRVYWLDLDDDD